MPLEMNEMFAFVARDESNDEGITVMPINGMLVPLLGADMSRIDSLRHFAQIIADWRGVPVQLIRFSQRETLETIYPTEEATERTDS